ncbi:unnamed protein product [Symbiodinium sp. CCMP2592]|nr:unnamed protein product [Symbiodinium sp. CCMP2592]
MEDEAERQRQGAASLRKFLQMQQAAGLAVPGMEMLAQISQPTRGKPSSMVIGTNEGDGRINAAPSRKECGTLSPVTKQSTAVTLKADDSRQSSVEALAENGDAEAEERRTTASPDEAAGISAPTIMGPEGFAIHSRPNAALRRREALNQQGPGPNSCSGTKRVASKQKGCGSFMGDQNRRVQAAPCKRTRAVCADFVSVPRVFAPAFYEEFSIIELHTLLSGMTDWTHDAMCLHGPHAAKKNGDKKAKKASKKEAKKAKKEAKKAKKLAKQIKKLEEEVEKRKRQIKGEVQEKKKKKKSSSSSSSSAAKKQKKGPNRLLNESAEQPPAAPEEHHVSQTAHEDAARCTRVTRSSQSTGSKDMQWFGGDAGDGEQERSPEPEQPEPEQSSSEESNPEVHEAVCDHCAMEPIVGPRFKCAICEDVSLCRKCYKRRQEIHRPSHRFFAMKPMQKPRGGDGTDQLTTATATRAQKAPVPVPATDVSGAPAETGPQGPLGFVALPPAVPVPIVPAVAQEVASQMQARFLDMGKTYAKSWQESVPLLQDLSSKRAVKVPKPEPSTKVGKQMVRGATCGLCLQQVVDSESGVLCFRIRADGTAAGCSKSVCFPCMARASSRMFGKVRVNKEIWVAMGAQAWWMHERCMTSEEVTEHAELVKSTGLEESLKVSAKLPKGWISKISKTTGKVYYVNAQKGKTQWTLPEEEVEETEESQDQPQHDEVPKAETEDNEAEKPQNDQEELTEL